MRLPGSLFVCLFSALLVFIVIETFRGFASAQDSAAVRNQPEEGNRERVEPSERAFGESDVRVENEPRTTNDYRDETRGEISSHESKASTGARVAYEVMGGVVGLLGAGFNGVIFGSIAAAATTCGEEEDFCGLGPVFIGIGIGGITGVFTLPLGVYIAGESAGGNGNYWITLLSHIAGAGLGWLTAYPLIKNTDEVAFIAIPIVAHFAGAILGYELSSSAAERSDGSHAAVFGSRGQLTILPTIATASNSRCLSFGVTGAYIF